MSKTSQNNRVVGLKQSRRAIQEGRVAEVFLAADADPRIRDQLISLCLEASVPISDGGTMAQLGALCGIEVGAAVVAVLK